MFKDHRSFSTSYSHFKIASHPQRRTDIAELQYSFLQKYDNFDVLTFGLADWGTQLIQSRLNK
jgi:hypothetical protein